MKRVLFAACCALTWIGCARSTAESGTRPDPEPERASSTSAPATAIPAAAALQPIASLDDKLAYESAARPRAAGRRSESALDALARAGLAVEDRQQHVASVFGAVYCLGARAQHGLTLSVCEYATPEAARAGREASAAALATVANREVLVNGALTLTLRRQAQGPASDALAKRASAAFARL